jgi:CTP:molybdopterin cytidylyltransferase MocA
VNASVAAIVLAAGASTRLGQPKQLLVHQGETLLARAIRLVSEAGASPVVCVLGANHTVIRESFQSGPATVVVNNQWQTGIASSIHSGLHAIENAAPNAVGVMILTCDQPRITAEHLRSLIETFAAQTKPSILASTYAGVTGVPALFPRAVFSELLALRGDKGARALLREPSCPLISLPLEGGEIDIDQPGDLPLLG